MKRTIRLARVKTISKKVLIKNAYEKNKKYKGWKVTYILFDWIYEQMLKRGFLQPHYDDVAVDTYDYTPSKEKLLSHRVMEAIHNYEYDFNTTVSPDKYVVVMGEDTYFETVKESDINTPFFYQPMEFSTDIVYYDPYDGRRSGAFSVHVIPGFDGFLILPKAIVEKKVYRDA